jgi:hypothetical protein
LLLEYCPGRQREIARNNHMSANSFSTQLVCAC